MSTKIFMVILLLQTVVIAYHLVSIDETLKIIEWKTHP